MRIKNLVATIFLLVSFSSSFASGAFLPNEDSGGKTTLLPNEANRATPEEEQRSRTNIKLKQAGDASTLETLTSTILDHAKIDTKVTSILYALIGILIVVNMFITIRSSSGTSFVPELVEMFIYAGVAIAVLGGAGYSSIGQKFSVDATICGVHYSSKGGESLIVDFYNVAKYISNTAACDMFGKHPEKEYNESVTDLMGLVLDDYLIECSTEAKANPDKESIVSCINKQKNKAELQAKEDEDLTWYQSIRKSLSNINKAFKTIVKSANVLVLKLASWLSGLAELLFFLWTTIFFMVSVLMFKIISPFLVLSTTRGAVIRSSKKFIELAMWNFVHKMMLIVFAAMFSAITTGIIASMGKLMENGTPPIEAATAFAILIYTSVLGGLVLQIFIVFKIPEFASAIVNLSLDQMNKVVKDTITSAGKAGVAIGAATVGAAALAAEAGASGGASLVKSGISAVRDRMADKSGASSSIGGDEVIGESESDSKIVGKGSSEASGAGGQEKSTKKSTQGTQDSIFKADRDNKKDKDSNKKDEKEYTVVQGDGQKLRVSVDYFEGSGFDDPSLRTLGRDKDTASDKAAIPSSGETVSQNDENLVTKTGTGNRDNLGSRTAKRNKALKSNIGSLKYRPVDSPLSRQEKRQKELDEVETFSDFQKATKEDRGSTVGDAIKGKIESMSTPGGAYRELRGAVGGAFRFANQMMTGMIDASSAAADGRAIDPSTFTRPIGSAKNEIANSFKQDGDDYKRYREFKEEKESKSQSNKAQYVAPAANFDKRARESAEVPDNSETQEILLKLDQVINDETMTQGQMKEVVREVSALPLDKMPQGQVTEITNKLNAIKEKSEVDPESNSADFQERKNIFDSDSVTFLNSMDSFSKSSRLSKSDLNTVNSLLNTPLTAKAYETYTSTYKAKIDALITQAYMEFGQSKKKS